VAKKPLRNKQPIPTRAAPPQPTPLTAPAVQQLMLGYDPSRPTVQMDIESTKTAWSEYTLSDKTVIRVKAVLIDVKKAVGQYGPDGKPVYIMQMTIVNDVVVPDELMRDSTKK
jgi:hypothetical protein